jgi:hypothetical protein
LAQDPVDLADLLTAGGVAAGAANVRLRVGNVPTLLQNFVLELSFDASVSLPAGACTLLLNGMETGNAQMQVLFQKAAGVTVTATYVAAPSLVPVAPGSGVVDP